MSEITHKLVTETYYSICLKTSNRMMPNKLNEFFNGFDFDSLGDDWHDNHSTLRDYEGDFEGIEIYFTDNLKPLFEYISKKIHVDFSELKKTSIKITCL